MKRKWKSYTKKCTEDNTGVWVIPITVQKELFTSVHAQDMMASDSPWKSVASLLASTFLWRSKPTPLRIWYRKLTTVNWLKEFYFQILKPSHTESFEDSLISYLEGSHASRQDTSSIQIEDSSQSKKSQLEIEYLHTKEGIKKFYQLCKKVEQILESFEGKDLIRLNVLLNTPSIQGRETTTGKQVGHSKKQSGQKQKISKKIHFSVNAVQLNELLKTTLKNGIGLLDGTLQMDIPLNEKIEATAGGSSYQLVATKQLKSTGNSTNSSGGSSGHNKKRKQSSDSTLLEMCSTMQCWSLAQEQDTKKYLVGCYKKQRNIRDLSLKGIWLEMEQETQTDTEPLQFQESWPTDLVCWLDLVGCLLLESDDKKLNLTRKLKDALFANDRTMLSIFQIEIKLPSQMASMAGNKSKRSRTVDAIELCTTLKWKRTTATPLIMSSSTTVSRSHLKGTEKEMKTRGICSPTYSKGLKICSLSLLFSKTLRESVRPRSQGILGNTRKGCLFSTMSSQSWKMWVIQQQQFQSQRQSAELTTQGHAGLSSLFSTPRARDGTELKLSVPNLHNKALTRETLEMPVQLLLEHAYGNLFFLAKKEICKNVKNHPELLKQMRSILSNPVVDITGLQENTRWREMAMGVPIGWTMIACTLPQAPHKMKQDCWEMALLLHKQHEQLRLDSQKFLKGGTR